MRLLSVPAASRGGQRVVCQARRPRQRRRHRSHGVRLAPCLRRITCRVTHASAVQPTAVTTPLCRWRRAGASHPRHSTLRCFTCDGLERCHAVHVNATCPLRLVRRCACARPVAGQRAIPHASRIDAARSTRRQPPTGRWWAHAPVDIATAHAEGDGGHVAAGVGRGAQGEPSAA